MPVTHPMASPYLAINRAAHLARWGIAVGGDGGTAVQVDSRATDASTASPVAETWPPEALLSVRVQDAATGRWIKMHSDRAPHAEAEAWWDSLDRTVTTAPVVALVGAGLGYLLDVVEQRSTASMLVVEPEPGLVPWLLARRDWRPLIDAGRLLILEGPRYGEAARAWGILARAPRLAPPIVAHPVTARVRTDAAREAGRAVTTVLQASRANALARRRFEAPYLVNTLSNIGACRDAMPVCVLDGAARHSPVVIAGAGPSLNRNIEQLRPWRDRVTLVATDTATRPLLQAGVRPDVIVAVDPGAANARHLEDLPPTRGTLLVSEASVDPRGLAQFAGRTALFRVADHAPWRWLTRVGIDPGRLRAWGSVITAAFDLALRLEADPIIFIGADLAYTDGQPYCRDTIYEQDWADEAARSGRHVTDVWADTVQRGGVTEPDVYDVPTPTAAHLIAYRDWLVQECADLAASACSPHVVNATGAGILHGPGVGQTALDALLSAAPVRRPPVVTMPTRLAPAPELTAIDAHLLAHLSRPPMEPPDCPAPTVTPFMRAPRGARVTATRRLRTQQATDTERWMDLGNLDEAWDRRAAFAGQLVPPGMVVLDLGAGRESLERYLPPDAIYVPADVVPRSPRTRVVDLNREQLPDDDVDVVAMLGVLEYVHDPTRLLRTLAARAELLVLSYCVMINGQAEARLQRGWMNDFTLSSLLDVLAATGWDVAWATRLDALGAFDQWLFACRPRRQA